ncbi:hypothetical protein [Pseudarthrobacter sp. fls2-241-R2A-168]|uniref:hypothetical protein n=1 Tax=Pseudarthrobacter sp. fls2-241-R2A-168 TaxID=3040304 RepID=UPI0025558A56|nr:hypothetical protein [Pseudarthrobacter sp. fls2-241-R2A-168]
MLILRPGVAVRSSALFFQSLPAVAAAQGLEGAVVACSNTPYLCKLLTQPLSPHEADAVQSLIDFREWAVVGPDREILRTFFSWPLHRVIDDASGLTVGVLIPRAEHRFYYAHGGSYHLREGQHLPRPESAAGYFSLRERLGVLRDLARAMDVLARHNYVYGDINSRNLAFSPDGVPAVFLLDCDGIRREGDLTLKPRHQQRWSDPHNPGVNSLATDQYLLALWILRVLTSSMAQPPVGACVDWGQTSIPLATHTELQRLLTAGLGPSFGRPSPADFLPILTALHRVA